MSLSTAAAFDRLVDAVIDFVGDTMNVNGVDFDCFLPPLEKQKLIKRGPYDADRTTTFQMRRTDFEASKLKELSTFLYQGDTMEIKTIKTDSVDSGVQLIVKLRQ